MEALAASLGANIALGFSVALSPTNVALCLAGCVLGTLIGVLPGIGPSATVAMLMPVTFYLSPVGALIMLAGVFYGSQYGGSTTAILVNLPGESSSIVTTLDGHAMAKEGRAGAALAVAALASLFAGTVTTLAIAAAGPPIAKFALLFQSPDYVAVMVLGLVAAVVLAQGSLPKALAMIVLGVFLGLVGTDVTTGMQRYTFGVNALFDGIGFVPVAMGLFGIAEIMHNLEATQGKGRVMRPMDRLWPSREDFRRAAPAAGRGTAMGLGLGILPGSTTDIPAYAAYSVEKRISSEPWRFGKGAVEGVAAPEAANNASAQAGFIPMLSLGIPPNAIMAMMIGAMMIHGIAPGPQIIDKQPALFWGLVASMWLGNAVLVVLNLPLIWLWVRLLTIPYRVLFPSIIVFCCIGCYSLKNNPADVVIMALFGVIGYGLKKLRFEPAPLVIGFILGPMLEENFRRAMLVSGGELSVFVTRPISAVFLAVSAALLFAVLMPAVRRARSGEVAG
ncbi:MAG: tripartite tricarboxylate transporter permease [Alphaproteobacteria bacterium]|nr:tripartite tricarboxylate transporter permease [Alphaproteobacteria bacterium]